MSASLPLLLIIAAMLLIVGVLAIAAIVLVAKKCSCRPDNKDNLSNNPPECIDPWLEAGKRVKEEYPEQDI